MVSRRPARRERVTITLPENVAQDLKEEARRRGVTPAAQVRELLTEYYAGRSEIELRRLLKVADRNRRRLEGRGGDEGAA